MVGRGLGVLPELKLLCGVGWMRSSRSKPFAHESKGPDTGASATSRVHDRLMALCGGIWLHLSHDLPCTLPS